MVVFWFCVGVRWEGTSGEDLPEGGRRGGEEPRNQFDWSVQEKMIDKLEEERTWELSKAVGDPVDWQLVGMDPHEGCLV